MFKTMHWSCFGYGGMVLKGFAGKISSLSIFVLTASSAHGAMAVIKSSPFSVTEKNLPVESCGATFGQRAIHDLVSISNHIMTESMQCARDVMIDAFVTESESENSSGKTDVWQSNSSMNMSQQLKLSRSPCLAVLTSRFYESVDKRFSKFDSDIDRGDLLPSTKRPSLAAEAGKGSFAELSPGFLMDSAMGLAAGRKSLAMAMIAHCGHDDQNNQIPTVLDFSSMRARNVVATYLNRDNAKKNQRQVEHLLRGGRMRAEIRCPKPNSPFYVAKAIGNEADIDPMLKKKIADVQAPTKGAGVLPGKAYHTMFGAIIGCRLAACGVSKGAIQSALALVANKYRTHRLNQTANNYLMVREMVEDHFGVNWADEKGIKAIEGEIDSWLNSKEGKAEMVRRGAASLTSNDRGAMPWSAWQSSIDSAVLHRGAIPGTPAAFQAVRLSEGRDPFYDPATINKPQTSYCPGWSEERCDNARKRYETWMIDFDWSEAQQRAGGGFGSDFCSSDPSSEAEIEERACEALERL